MIKLQSLVAVLHNNAQERSKTRFAELLYFARSPVGSGGVGGGSNGGVGVRLESEQQSVTGNVKNQLMT